MRKKIVAGNWKMNKEYTEGLALFADIQERLRKDSPKGIEVVIIPPFIFISEFAKQATVVAIGAQNSHCYAGGSYTGEISAAMVSSAGAKYVLVGHSERRLYSHEKGNELAAKIDIALIQDNLSPIYCVGENTDERRDARQFEIVKQQLKEGVFHLEAQLFKKIIIAYEPVWAIGTGVTATPAQAQEMHAYIRKVIKEKYDESIANSCSILYGGSCTDLNAKQLFSCADVDGGLIGGASLNAQNFVKIVNSF